MTAPFWQNRINPLKKDKTPVAAETVGAYVIDGRGRVTALIDGGALERFATVPDFLDWALASEPPFLWYTHVRQRDDIGRDFEDGNGYAWLLGAGCHVRLFQSQGHTAALEVFATVCPEEATPKTAHWSFRDLGNLLPDLQRHADPATMCGQILRTVRKVQTDVEAAFGTNLEMTATRTGYVGWRRTLATYHWRQPRACRADVRKAYRGGYTRAFTTKRHHGGTWRQYDIRSAYPAAMRRGVPVGQPVRVAADYDEEHPEAVGFYHIMAILPPRGLPVLLAWDEVERADVPIQRGAPTYLWVSSQELALARELGAVCRVLGGWAWPAGIGYPFNDFVDRCEAWRDASTGSSQAMVKLIQNTLYGKFGTNPKQKEVVISEEAPAGREWMPYYAASGPIDGAWWRQVDTDSRAGQMIHWAAWITATVRCQVIRAVRDIGPENVLYVDTDCIITSGTMPTGTRYGDWVLQRTYRDFQAFAGKRYEGHTVEGAHIVKHAGLNAELGERFIVAAMQEMAARAGP